jgi:hypothetical protein
MPEILPKGVKDLRGLTFGSLTPQFITEIKYGEGAVWHCACECGEAHEVLSSHLLRGRVRWCLNCARKHRVVQLADARKYRGIDGVSVSQAGAYDMLTALERAEVDEMLARRRRNNIEITPALIASCVSTVRCAPALMAA